VNIKERKKPVFFIHNLNANVFYGVTSTIYSALVEKKQREENQRILIILKYWISICNFHKSEHNRTVLKRFTAEERKQIGKANKLINKKKEEEWRKSVFEGPEE
jgi:hypothetical protein